MRRVLLILLAAVFCLSLYSCTSASDMYGTWYVDEGDTRNVIQFSENAEGKDVYIWAVYNIKDDSIESNNTGYYKISGDQIIFGYGEETDKFELSFELDGDKLTLFSETATMILTKYVLN